MTDLCRDRGPAAQGGLSQEVQSWLGLCFAAGAQPGTVRIYPAWDRGCFPNQPRPCLAWLMCGWGDGGSVI